MKALREHSVASRKSMQSCRLAAQRQGDCYTSMLSYSARPPVCMPLQLATTAWINTLLTDYAYMHYCHYYSVLSQARTARLQAAYMLAAGAHNANINAAAAAAGGSSTNSVFQFTDDEEKASRMLEEMSVSGASLSAAGAASTPGGVGTPGGNFGGTPGGTPGGGDGGVSPPLSPMYFSPKGLSPRTNILPSFAWGKTLFKQLVSLLC
jgi:hypothetical protein